MDIKKLAQMMMEKAGFKQANVLDPEGTVEALRALGVTINEAGPEWWKQATVHSSDGTSRPVELRR